MSWDKVIVGRESITLEATPRPLASEIFELADLLCSRAGDPGGDFVLEMSPNVLRKLRRRSLPWRKAFRPPRRHGRAAHRAHKRARRDVWLAYAVPAALKALVEAHVEASKKMWDGVAEVLSRRAGKLEGAGRWSGRAVYFDVVERKANGPQ